MPISVYCYLTVRYTNPILPYHSKIQYSQIEEVQNNRDIKHNGTRGVLEFLNEEDGVEILHYCDVPNRTGLGSSSAFIVGLLKAFHTLEGNEFISPKKLAKQAIRIEREILAEPGGIQDSCLAATNTGLTALEISTSGDFDMKPLRLSREFCDMFTSCLSLIYIGAGRQAFEISHSLDQPSTEDTKLKYKDLAHEALIQFEKENIFGKGGIAELLEKTWLLKRDISPLVSNDRVEEVYQKCKSSGAQAFKLLGAGANGFCLALTRPEYTEEFREKLDLPIQPFKIDYEGSKVIYRSDN